LKADGETIHQRLKRFHANILQRKECLP
jgi:hypothetical protein